MFSRAVMSLFAAAALACANGCCYCQSNHCWFWPHCGFMGAQACDCPQNGGLLGFGLLSCNHGCDSCGGCGGCSSCGECGGGCGSCGGGCSNCGGGCPLFNWCHGNSCGCGCDNWCGGAKYPDMGCSGICWDGYDDCGCDPCDNCGNWVGGGCSSCSSCGGGGQYSYGGGYSEGYGDDQFASSTRARRGGTGTMVASRPTSNMRTSPSMHAAPQESYVVENQDRFTGRPRYSTATKPKSVQQQPTPAAPVASKNNGRSVSYETRAGERLDDTQKPYELH